MKPKLKSASRLSIVFILVVLISGSILTYFSINNISNLKELTEKKILEEQRELSQRFSSALQNKLNAITFGFKEEINPLFVLKDSLRKVTADYDFIALPFILKNNGNLLYPNFIGITENLVETKLPPKFISAFRKGEEIEFNKRDLITAQNYYASILSYSRGCSDSAKALNALGRVSVKLNNEEKAIKNYSKLISDYFKETDRNGLPYVYYALPQLLKITTPDNCKKLFPMIGICLEKIEVGSIPLTFNTDELLNQVDECLKQQSAEGIKGISRFNDLRESIMQQINFTKEYNTEFSEFIKKGDFTNNSPVGNNFMVINSLSGNSQNMLLLNTNYRNHIGFLLDKEKLFNSVIKYDLQSGLEFDYKIELVNAYNSKTIGNKLIYSSQINQFFPGFLLQVKLNNENLIKDLIERKSWIYGIGTVLLLVGMFLGIALIIRDTTREKHLARLRSDFISNVTHELKTPLTSIHMFSESLLLDRVKSIADRKEYLSIIIKESERLKRMINNILEFSKTEKGKSEYHFVNSNLALIVKAALKEMEYWFEKEKFNVVTELNENIYAEVDPEKMQQVISNLLSNAIKYSNDKKKIFIRLFDKANHVCVEVEDFGIGMPKDKIDKIFEEFYRIEQKEGISGTGLGLTVVKEIIEAHKGKISVTSEVGKGSKFLITLNGSAEKSENNISN